MTDTRPHLNHGGTQSRREFLRRASLFAAAGALTPFALDLAGITSGSSDSSTGSPLATGSPSSSSLAPAGSRSTDYRALVCVYLLGGNDHNASFIPYDRSSYATFREMRPGLAPDRGLLSPLGAGDDAGRQIALAPELSALRPMFDNGSLAVLANVGTLAAPMTKSAYRNVSNRPAQLFSHNDQQTMWQSARPGQTTEGWGGRLGDLLLDGNGEHGVFTCMSTGGTATMLSGRQVRQYQVGQEGVTELSPVFRSDALLDGLRDVMDSPADGLLDGAYKDVTRAALNSSETLAATLPPLSETMFPQSSLGRQLSMVTRLIDAGRKDLGLRRQVFFVAAGGFDTHALQGQNLPKLLKDLADSLAAFDHSLSASGVAPNVTTFTASDFGRTLNWNGDGTDHGWGSHHLVMGGSVRGGRVYGALPAIADDGPDDVGRGRVIPKTAVDQYASTLARWMGVGSDSMEAITPNVARFETADLEFMEASSTPQPPPDVSKPPVVPPPPKNPKPPRREDPDADDRPDERPGTTGPTSKPDVRPKVDVEQGGVSIDDSASEGLRQARRGE